MGTKYKVSVRLMTYQHAPYIKKAMESILMQKTNFLVEVVVGDDFSTDGTLEIVRKFKSSDNIHIKILERAIGDKYWERRQKYGRLYNFINILENCNGEYIALLDGDDYWTDPYKLQKQVDFLEANPEYGMVHTDNSNLFQESGRLVYSHKKTYYPDPPSGFIFNELIKKNFISTLTVVVKKKLILNAYQKLRKVMDINLIYDYALWLEISRMTKIKYINQVTSVYRVSKNTVSRPESVEKRIKWEDTVEAIQDFFLKYYEVGSTIKNEIYYNRISKKLRLQYRKSEFSKLRIKIEKDFRPQNFKDSLLFFLYMNNSNRIWYILLESPFIIFRKIKKIINR